MEKTNETKRNETKNGKLQKQNCHGSSFILPNNKSISRFCFTPFLGKTTHDDDDDDDDDHPHSRALRSIQLLTTEQFTLITSTPQ